MPFLGNEHSHLAVALRQKRGPANLGASEVPTGDREHSWAPAVPSGSSLAGAQAAQLLSQPNASATHRGNLQLIGGLPRDSRGYSPHTGSSALRPTLPLMPPSITRAVLSVTNADDGTANLMGEQGYALHVPQGVTRFDGPVWGGQWVRIDGVGHFTDTRAGELGAGVDPEHHYADGTVCGDSKGRGQTDIPTRIFYMHESDLPAVGDYIFELMRDQYGASWGGGPGGTARQGLGKITAEWSWVTGQENVVGRFAFNPTTALIDGTPDTTRTYSALAPSGPGIDPNGQKDSVFGYNWGPGGSRIAITANVYDEKVGSVKPWLGGLGSIPGGWVLVTSSSEGAGHYLVGYAAGGDYATPGDHTLGRHPIRPLPHAAAPSGKKASGITIDDHESAEVSSSTSHITVADHAAVNVTATSTGISVNSHAAVNVTATSTEISVNDHPSVRVSRETVELVISDHYSSDVHSSDVIIADHPNHVHAGPDDGWFISGIGGASGEGSTPATDSDGDTMDVAWFYKVGFDPVTGLSGVQVTEGGGALTLTHSAEPHHHTTRVFAHEIFETAHTHTTPIMSHVVVESPHLHTTPVLTHVVNDIGHLHTTPVLTHSVNDAGHFHTTAVLTHTLKDDGHQHTSPAHVHAEEDFRSPGVVMVLIKRVGPNGN